MTRDILHVIFKIVHSSKSGPKVPPILKSLMSYKEDYIDDENSDEKVILEEENAKVEKNIDNDAEKEMILPKNKKPISNLKKLGNAKFR